MDLSSIKNYIDDRPADGVFRVHKDVYSDPELFELEMKYIFERTWSFLGHESQLPKPHDWFVHLADRLDRWEVSPACVSADAPFQQVLRIVAS